MNKPLLGLLLGGILGVFDGLSALLSAPETAPLIVGIVIGSTVKGLIVGVLVGWFAKNYIRCRRVSSSVWRRVHSSPSSWPRCPIPQASIITGRSCCRGASSG